MASKDGRQSIFIGIPCYGDVSPETLDDFMRFAFHCGRRLPQYDFFIGIKSKTEQFRARNAIAEGALQVDADWLLMLDDDMVINHIGSMGATDDYSFIERLIAHDKDVCGALYYQRSGNCSPVLMKKVGDTEGYRFLRPDEVEGKLQRVDVAGGGCLLIKTRVLDKIPHPYFEPEFQYGTDIQICRKAAERGMEVWADTSIELGHVKSERIVVTSRNRHQFVSETIPGEMKRTFVASDTYNRLIEDALSWTGYRDMGEVASNSSAFLKKWNDRPAGQSDADWYRQFPKERVARQVWFNTDIDDKRVMTEFIISSIDSRKSVDILDYGCGIGIPAFALAEKGHRVTALDIAGTGTFDFLKYRVLKNGVRMRFIDSLGGVPVLGGGMYDVIIAMDTLEHTPEWRDILRVLVAHLKPMGVLFCNNGILDDQMHPEHYSLDNKEFITECVNLGVMPFNQFTYVKRKEQSVDLGLTEAVGSVQ